MIKLRAGSLVLIGLSEGNIRLMKEGKPIYFDGEAVGLDRLKIALAYSETELALARELRDEWGLKIRFDDRDEPINVRDGKQES